RAPRAQQLGRDEAQRREQEHEREQREQRQILLQGHGAQAIRESDRCRNAWRARFRAGAPAGNGPRPASTLSAGREHLNARREHTGARPHVDNADDDSTRSPHAEAWASAATGGTDPATGESDFWSTPKSGRTAKAATPGRGTDVTAA